MTPIRSTVVELSARFRVEAQWIAGEINAFTALNLCDDMPEDSLAPQVGWNGNGLVIPEEVRDTFLFGVTQTLPITEELRARLVQGLSKEPVT